MLILERFTAAGSCQRGRDSVRADGREVGAEVRPRPGRVGGGRWAAVGPFLTQIVSKVHGQRRKKGPSGRQKSKKRGTRLG